MCLLSLQGRDKIIGVSTERPPRESSEIGGTAIKKTVMMSEHQVRLRCFPLTSIEKGNQELAALSAMQSRGWTS